MYYDHILGGCQNCNTIFEVFLGNCNVTISYNFRVTRTRLKSHHGAAVTSRVAGATKNSSHITTLKSHHGHHFLKEFIAGANESSKSYFHIFSIQIKKSLRARSPYAICKWNLRIIHSHLHWGAGFDSSVVYAPIIALYIFPLTGYVPRAPDKATETRLILLNLQGSSSPAVLTPTLLSRRPSRNIQDDFFFCIIPMFSWTFSSFSCICSMNFNVFIGCVIVVLHMFNVFIGCLIVFLHIFNVSIGCLIVFLHFANVFVGCLIVFLHLSNVCSDFRKGRERSFFKIKDWST